MIVLPNSHSEWLEERKYGIGASDAAAIVGRSKWKSNVQLWEEKVGLRTPEDISSKPYVQYGHDAEPHLRALFALDHPELEVTYESPYKMIRNDEHLFIFCTPDGELLEKETGRRGGLEIKTTEIQRRQQWDDWRDRIPDVYYAQVLWQFLATGWDFIYLNAQIKWTAANGKRRKTTQEELIERSEVQEDLEYLLTEGVAFWESVQRETRPALRLPEI